MKTIFIIFALCFIVTTSSAYERILLKSGNSVQGNIIEVEEDYIKVDHHLGIPITYYIDEITSINGNENLNEALKSLQVKDWVEDENEISETRKMIVDLATQQLKDPNRDAIKELNAKSRQYMKGMSMCRKPNTAHATTPTMTVLVTSPTVARMLMIHLRSAMSARLMCNAPANRRKLSMPCIKAMLKSIVPRISAARVRTPSKPK